VTRLARIAVTGIGFWSPRLPGWNVACDIANGRGSMPDAPLSRPAPALLAPTERRRAPDTVALAIDVASQACQMAGLSPRDVPSVFASTYGDLPINDYMCSTLVQTPTLCSPTKFHNSVHNAAAGYWTIGTGSVRASTALLAGPDTFAAGLLEAISQALTESAPVLYVAYDVAARGPLATMTQSEGLLAASLVLDPRPSATAGARISCSLDEFDGTHPATASLPAGWLAALPANAMAPALPLFAALARGADAHLQWQLGRRCRLGVDISHHGQAAQ
jgi:hypothetical protein